MFKKRKEYPSASLIHKILVQFNLNTNERLEKIEKKVSIAENKAGTAMELLSSKEGAIEKLENRIMELEIYVTLLKLKEMSREELEKMVLDKQ